MRIPALAAASLIGAAAFVHPASAATFNVLYNFCQGSNFTCRSGKMPTAPLIADASGDLYGTTSQGGETASGTIFRLHRTSATEWKYQVLHGFQCAETCAEGGAPVGALIMDTDGNLYGTASQGGSDFGGTAFKLTHNPDDSWTYSVLIDFCSATGAGCVQGQVPESPLAYAGNASGALYDGVSPLYGTTLQGGSGGVAYRLTHSGDSWSGDVVRLFCQEANCADGGFPVGRLQVDDKGKFLYGETNGGGNENGAGVAYKIVLATGAETVLHTFCSKADCADGQGATGGVTLSGKTLLGTAPLGGKNGGGALFTLNTGNGKEKVTYSFCKQPNCTDGQNPNSAPVPVGGSLLGTASGGIDFNGVVYQAGPGKAETVLHTFCQEAECLDGAGPVGGVLVDPAGTIYGVTQRGGTKGWGVIYSLTP